MILLIDAGNSRVKWAMVATDTQQWLASGTVMLHELAALQPLLTQYAPLEAVFCANVAGGIALQQIKQLLQDRVPAIHWATASRQAHDVQNSYQDPQQLGVDRWCALLAARTLFPQHNCLVVTAGTATTIDQLTQDGIFIGGYILPGERLMRQALKNGTAQLPFHEGVFSAAPTNTQNAILSGCRLAQAGTIHQAYHEMPATNVRCIVNGGAADTICPQLTIPFIREENLVLKGLAVYAGLPQACYRSRSH